MENTLEFGVLLKDWRNRRRMSQLDLAMEAEISSRHLSFIETGRSRPTRSMVLRIAEQLEMPLRERNNLLLAAGLSPEYRETPENDPAAKAVLSALGEMIERMMPMPALIIDGAWNLVAANAMIGLLIGGADASLLAPPVNVLRLSLHPKGLAERIRNFAVWHAHLMERVERQLAMTGDRRLRALVEELRGYPAATADTLPDHANGPAVSLELEVGGEVLSFMSTTMVIGGPRDVVLSELAVEMFLPTDETTKSWLAKAHQSL
jgi:transcriptional regulator with XRE-family HTH domain